MHSTVSLQENRVSSEQRVRHAVNVSTLIVVVVGSAWIFSAPLRNATRMMPFVEDDFYYYLKVAQNVAAGRDSTFNGITRTNGYHPLYFVLLVFISKCAHTLAGVFRALWLLWIVATTATFLTARKLLQRPGLGPFFTNAVALIFLVPCIHIFCQGMEVTLTIPLGLGLLLAFRTTPGNWTLWQSVAIGLLAALTIASRLDAIFLVLLLLGFTLFDPQQRSGIRFRQIGGFAAGVTPLLLVYFLFNRIYFHTWMPVSGAAKQLKSSPWPTLTALRYGGLNTAFLVAFLLWAAVAFWLLRKRLAPQERVVLAAAAAFPYLQIAVLSTLSDWPLWGWYYYTLRFALLAGLVLLLTLPGEGRMARPPRWIKAVAYGVAVGLFLRVHWKKEPQMDQIYDVAIQIKAFAQAHPGVYAIGGGAGMTGYLLQDPVVQTEGLMMDPAYLGHIRRQDNLLVTLRGYGVRYYSVWEPRGFSGLDKNRFGKCLLAEEPDDATGHVTLHMRATLCAPPIANIVSDHVINHIYDLNQQ